MTRGSQTQSGMTLIELILAMAIFSMALLIIIGGFINVLHLRDQAIAMNTVQDNARSSVDELTQAIRDSSNGTMPIAAGSGTSGTLCLTGSTGPDQYFSIQSNVLQRADGCPPSAQTNVRKLTSSTGVRVTDFTPRLVQPPAGSINGKAEVQVSLTIASATAIVNGAGEIECGSSIQQRSFCNVVTITSGGTPR